ncbi:hypothetical protein C922_03277 [Plasmodium inui San Antonio 1]|uniref:Uncharacterized protein n=1 Tax=Plasmodium inui San Antonio 1 TaxID=1237626 RepID=W7AM05_9APIC|nr:hypothetical protein C922_03277 [Plasmodium inui San Antonio 1]EUD66361.1 hypothetical protein C922_03277 [Plasmodium inui San Antonio 1]
MFKFLHDIDVAKRKLLNTINNKLALPNEDDECLFPGDEQTMSRALGAGECWLPIKGDSPKGEGGEEEGEEDEEGDDEQDDEQDDEGDGEDDSSETDEDDSVQYSGDNVSESDGDAETSVRNGHEETDTHEENEKREDKAEGVATGGLEARGAAWRRKDAPTMCAPPQGEVHVQSASAGRRMKAQKGQSRQGSERHEESSRIATGSTVIMGSEVSTQVGAIPLAQTIRGHCGHSEHSRPSERGESSEPGSRAMPHNEGQVDETERSYLPKLKKETQKWKGKKPKADTNILTESTFYNNLKQKVANSLCCKVDRKKYDDVVEQMIQLRKLFREEANLMVDTGKGQSTEGSCSRQQQRKMAEECATKICDLVLGDRSKLFGKLPIHRSGDGKDEKDEKSDESDKEEQILSDDTNEKTKNAKEIIELKRRNKILNDINERQTKQLLQLSCHLSSNIKSDSETSERNYISAKVHCMEKELTQLKGELALLEELASDKNVLVKKNYELGCLIKSLEVSLQRKSHLCVSLWREKHDLQKRLQRCREQVQLSREDLRACRAAFLDMKQREKRLAFQFKGLIKTRGDRAGGEMSLRRHKRKGRLKLRVRTESAACNDSARDPPSERPKGVHFERHPKSVYPPRRTNSADPLRPPPVAPQSHASNYYISAGAICDGNSAADFRGDCGALEELSRKVNNYKFFIDEWKSFSVRIKKKKDAEFKETKKLLSQQVAKNEMLEKKYQTLLEKMRSLGRGADKGSAMGTEMGSVTDGGIRCEGSHQDGVCPKTKELIDEVHFLTSEVDKLREDQLLLQEDVKKKSTIIVHLIEKQALSEEHFRLEKRLPILNNKLTYDEIRKIMEETLIENIRLRSDLVTLAKCVKGDSAGSSVGQDNPGA